MPPLGRFFRPVLAMGVTAGIVIGGEVTQRLARDDLEALGKKYPAIAATEPFVNLLSNPIAQLITGGFGALGLATIDSTIAATLSEEDKQRYATARGILKWVPFVEIAALVVGVPLSLYFVWADLFDGPRRARQAAATAAPIAAAIPAPQAQIAAPILAAAGTPPPPPIMVVPA